MSQTKPFKFDVKFLDKASDSAGTYIESLGRTDLADLTADEFDTLLVKMFVGAWPTDNLDEADQIATIDAARNAAGAYLETLPTTDMMRWSHHQFRKLCDVVLDAYTEALVPF